MRTLGLYLSPSLPPPTVPAELSLLVQRLSLLSAQLRDTPTAEEEGKREDGLEQLLQQTLRLQVAAKENLPPSSPDKPMRKRRAIRERRPRGGRKKGVLLGPRARRSPTVRRHASRGHTHFSQQTYSSLRKQQQQQPQIGRHLSSPAHRTPNDSHRHSPPITPSPTRRTPRASHRHSPPITPSLLFSPLKQAPHPPPSTRKVQFHGHHSPESESTPDGHGGRTACIRMATYGEGGSSGSDVSLDLLAANLPALDYPAGPVADCDPLSRQPPSLREERTHQSTKPYRHKSTHSPSARKEVHLQDMEGEGTTTVPCKSSLQSRLLGLTTTAVVRKADTISEQLVEDLLHDTAEECQR